MSNADRRAMILILLLLGLIEKYNAGFSENINSLLWDLLLKVYKVRIDSKGKVVVKDSDASKMTKLYDDLEIHLDNEWAGKDIDKKAVVAYLVYEVAKYHIDFICTEEKLDIWVKIFSSIVESDFDIYESPFNHFEAKKILKYVIESYGRLF